MRTFLCQLKVVLFFSQPSYGHGFGQQSYGSGHGHNSYGSGYHHKGYGYNYDGKHIYDTYKKVGYYSKKQDDISYQKLNVKDQYDNQPRNKRSVFECGVSTCFYLNTCKYWAGEYI